jgi:hypothetical protein
MKKIATAAFIILISTAAAHAERAFLKNSVGDSMKLWCDNSGCFTNIKVKGGRYAGKEKIGPGGSQNFKAHKARFKGKGWK